MDSGIIDNIEVKTRKWSVEQLESDGQLTTDRVKPDIWQAIKCGCTSSLCDTDSDVTN